MLAFTPMLETPAQVKQCLYDLFNAGIIAFITGAHPIRIRFLLPIAALTSDDITIIQAVFKK